ncbi:MAG TPA: AI-2E family transporter [Bryobacteraceae bacterium]|jgi:predicted PurR-regulated permease PerM|nr:AI-2E family transporter [Bryobacteraceae bacterium]
MLGFDPKAGRAAWTVFLVGLCIAIAYFIRGTLVVLALAILFAYLLTPIITFVRRYLPRRVSPIFALAIVYVALVGILVAAGIAIGSRVAEEASALASKLPEVVQSQEWQSRIPLPYWLDRTRALGFIKDQLAARGRDFVPYLQQIGAQVVVGARYLGFAVLIPVLAFFFLKDGPEMQSSLLGHIPGSRRTMVESILSDIDTLLGQYIRALVLQALSAFALYALFLGFTGAPYAILLAAVAGPLEFFPIIGPLTAGVITALVTGLSGYPHVLAFIVFWIVLRGFQDYVLIPFLLGEGVELSPLWILFGVLAGDQIAGIAGMFFSVPVMAIFRVVFVRLNRRALTQPLEASHRVCAEE